MKVQYPPEYAAASPDDILAWIRDSHRQQCQFDSEAESDIMLTFETTIDQWRSACDLLGWRELGCALNEEWKLGCREDAWRAVLEPSRTRTLGDLCAFIAEGARIPRIRPARLLGAPCRTAGAFLTIRSLLHDAGAEVETLAPSTPLAEYARHHLDAFLGPISRLSPGALPDVKLFTPWYDLFCFGILASSVTMLVGWRFSPTLFAIGLALIPFFYALVWIATTGVPSRVEFGTLRTFRDLAVVVVQGARFDSPPSGMMA
jgi:hypothetical protein